MHRFISIVVAATLLLLTASVVPAAAKQHSHPTSAINPLCNDKAYVKRHPGKCPGQ